METIDTLTYFDVNTDIADILEKVVLFDEYGRDAGKADASILRTAKRGIQIEVAYVVDGKLGVLAREDALDYKFDEF